MDGYEHLHEGVCDHCGAPCNFDPRWRYLDGTAHHKCAAGYQAAGHNGRWIHRNHYDQIRSLKARIAELEAENARVQGQYDELSALYKDHVYAAGQGAAADAAEAMYNSMRGME